MLQHTHTLPVNIQGQTPINIAQLWTGLLMRIIEQTQFTPGLDRVEVLAQSAQHYSRALHFGSFVVHDEVSCIHHESIEFVTTPADNIPSGRLLIRILDTDVLSLSFSYTTEFPDASNDEERQLLEIVKSAYMAADVDMIRIIREMALGTRH